MRERDGSDGREEGGWKETRRGQHNDEKRSNFSAVIRNSGVLLFSRTNQSSAIFIHGCAAEAGHLMFMLL